MLKDDYAHHFKIPKGHKSDFNALGEIAILLRQITEIQKELKILNSHLRYREMDLELLENIMYLHFSLIVKESYLNELIEDYNNKNFINLYKKENIYNVKIIRKSK